MATAEAAASTILQVLGEMLPSATGLSLDASLRSLRLDSIMAARLLLEVQRAHGIAVPFESLAECADLKGLAAHIASRAKAIGPEQRPLVTAPRGIESHPSERLAPFSLTPLQEAYLMGKQQDLTPDAVGCHIYREFEAIDLDAERLRRAWHQVVEHHDALRLAVTADGTQHVQEQTPTWTMPVHDLTTHSAKEFDRHVEKVRGRLSHRFYQPGQWPLFSIEVSLSGTGKGLIHFSIDGLVTDGHGLGLLLDHWWRVYQDPDCPLPKSKLSLRDCLLTLQQDRRSEAYQNDLDFWIAKLEGMPSGPRITATGETVSEEGLRCLRRRSVDGWLDARDWATLRERAFAFDVSPTALLLTVFAEALARLGADLPFSLLITTSSRLRLPSAVDRLAGPFTSTMMLVVPETLSGSFEEAAQTIQRRLWQGLNHSAVSGVSIKRELRARGKPAGNMELPVVFTSLLDLAPCGQGRSLAAATTHALSQTSGVALDHQVWEQDGQLRYRWDVAESCLKEGLVETLLATFANSLELLCQKDVSRPSELNELQQAYFVARAMGKTRGWDGCQVYHGFHVRDLNIDRLEDAWLRLVAQYEVLRSTVTHDGQLLIRTSAPRRWRIPLVDLRRSEDPKRVVADIRDRMAGRAFPLGRWPPFELRVTQEEKGRAMVHCALDLIVMDGRSIHWALRELFRLYADPDAKPRTALPLGEHQRQQDDLLSSPERAEWDQYWKRRFEALPPGPLPERKDHKPSDGSRTRLQGRTQGWQRLKERARDRLLSPDMLLLAAFAQALATKFPDSFSLPVVRWTEGERFRPGELTVLNWVTRAAGKRPLLDQAFTFQREIEADPPSSGLKELRKVVLRKRQRRAFSLPIVYTSILDLSDFALPAAVSLGEWMTYTPDVSLDSIAIEEGDELRTYWDAVEADFPDDMLDEMFAVFQSILHSLVAEETLWQDDGLPPVAQGAAKNDSVPALSDEDFRKIVYTWNSTSSPFAAEYPAHRLFEEQAAKRPEAIALRGAGGRLSYRELNRRANRIAWWLKDIGVGPEAVVGVSLNRGPEMVAAVLGVLKAGGAYLPVEPSLPLERARLILREAKATTLIAAPDSPLGHLPEMRIVEVDHEACQNGEWPSHDPQLTAGPLNTAYVIFTSGSTGKPKGVAVAHRSVLNLLHWCYRTFGFCPTDLGLGVTSLGFDLSVFDILGLLGCGAGLYLADEVQQKDPQLLLDILLHEPITFWNSAPATLAQLSPLLAEEVGRRGTDDLRLVFLSGDFTPLSLPNDVRRIFRNARMVSLGGATEATVWSNYFPIGSIDSSWKSIPYGRPMDNARYYILDAGLAPCPVGREGDLYIAGECLSLGYCHQPSMTAQTFLPDPLARGPGQRMYRTGDRAAYFADGNICFRGRADSQVKVRGFRVELGEIEHCLRQHPGVKEAVVLARSDPSGDRKLVAYLIPSSTPPEAKCIREHAARTLPEYMVPNFVAFMKAFPATANGKLDREALTWPLPEVPDASETEASSSGTSTEELTAEIGSLLGQLLGLPKIDPGQDLWDQGATSFTMVQLSSALKKRYRKRIPVSILQSDPTVDGIARSMADRLTGHPQEAQRPDGAQPEVSRSAGGTALNSASGPESEAVEFFSPQERAAFKGADLNLRPRREREGTIPLRTIKFAEEHYSWRSSCRHFGREPIPQESFSRLLSLLRETTLEGRRRYLYPSAGDTYAVQIYLHLKERAVEGIAEGIYYYNPREHTLQPIGGQPRIDRSCHFFYNRSLFDNASFGLFLIGQTKAIQPLYGEDSLRFLLLEAGYLGQLLMMGQAACGVGLCPIGHLAFDRIRNQLDLDSGHCFLHSFLGGPAVHPLQAESTKEKPAFSAVGNDKEHSTDIAIIGLAGRYPGAENIERFWRNLSAGKHSIGPFPARRQETYQSHSAKTNECLSVPGGYLPDIDSFDSLLFHISPQEARRLDPQMRLLLEVVWECLENAGYAPASLRRSADRIGVFVGVMWNDYQQVGADDWRRNGKAEVFALASDLPNRISHFFDFDGPSLAVNTSCSSSLTAVHLAVESLQRGECDVALVGGVNLMAHPFHLGLLSGSNLVSEERSQGAFDGDASGWSPGEGAGAVLLRPVPSAFQARDGIHGIIEAAAVGHAGGGCRFATPNTDSLAASMSRCLTRAGAKTDDIGYVECAAAGTSLADASEIEALAKVFQGARKRVPVGTLKPNIGHLEAASGLSQLTKVLLQMKHRQIAPTLAAKNLNPLLSWDGLPVRIAERIEAWAPEDGEPLRALITALSATGSFAHLVIRSPGASAPPPVQSGEQAILISAAGQEQLAESVRRLAEFLAETERNDAAPPLADIAFTLQTGRVHLSHRLALFCSSLDELRTKLEAVGHQGTAEGAAAGIVEDPVAGRQSFPVTPRQAADAWLRGCRVGWERFWDPPGRRVALPSYPFAKDRHRLESGYAEGQLQAQPERSRNERDCRRSIEEYLKQIYSMTSGIPVGRLSTRVRLEHYGLNSRQVLQLNHCLERDFGESSRTLFFEHSDLSSVADHLAKRQEHLLSSRHLPQKDDGSQRHNSTSPAGKCLGRDEAAGANENIAIIGIAGRYPQAPDLDRFWKHLEEGRDCITPLPLERRRAEWPSDLMWGGYLGEVDRFDPLFFNISPRDAALMDPQERLFLEVVWETLEDAGYTRALLRDRHQSQVSVHVGVMYNEYPFFGVEQSCAGRPVALGSALAGIANRVSYFLDLNGPSMAVDTMCSSSLTAIHLAVESLLRGECQVAIAGGVNLNLHPNKFIQQACLKMNSSDHRCRSFGAGGDGFVPGEGVGAVLLKPLGQAVADRDRIQAVIRGTSVNHDGRTNGYMVPNPVAQGDLILQAVHRAGIRPSTVSYLEAHGTGTKLGDPIEINGLTRAFAEDPPPNGSCAIGSVKSNIGHLEAAAGIAGLTKVVLQMKHDRLVPSLHAQTLTAEVDWETSSFRVQRELADWKPSVPGGKIVPRRAGVSAFGAGGANAHVILEAYEDPQVSEDEEVAVGPQLIVLSAQNEKALNAMAARLLDHLRRDARRSGQGLRIENIAYTLQVGREALPERLALASGDLDGLRAQLERIVEGEPTEALRGRAPREPRPSQHPLPEEGPKPDLLKVARSWVAGDTVDWNRFHQGRRPLLVDLPHYPFASVPCRLPIPESQAAQRPPENRIPLYEKTWKAAEAVSLHLRLGSGRVVCLFQRGSEKLAREIRLAAGEDRILLLREGSDSNDGLPSYDDERSAIQGMESLLVRHPDIRGWIDLCDLDREDDESGPWTARLAMLQLLLRRRRGKSLKLLQVTSGLLELAGPTPSLSGARIAGFMRVLGAEYPSVDAGVLDTESEADRFPTIARRILAEWTLCGASPEVCYRQGKKFLPRLSEVTATSQQTLNLDPNKSYIITGATRGIGALVARHMVSRGARKLALFGRKPVPERRHWNESGLSAEAQATIDQVHGLEGRGARVMLYTGRLVSRSRLAAFLTEVRGSLGAIGGVIHCAGRVGKGEASFIQKDLREVSQVFEPKVDGLEILADLCSLDQPSFFVLFSSVSAVVPSLGAGVSDYAAANAYMDFFAGHQFRRGRTYFRSINWPCWRKNGVGCTQPDPDPRTEACGRVGLGSISDAEGLALLDQLLTPLGRSNVMPGPAFGQGFDLEALLQSQQSTLPTEAVASGQRTPAWLVQLFSESLCLSPDNLDPTAHFGDLGIESVMLAELLQKIEARLQRRLEPSVLLNHPTLERLSAHLAGLEDSSESPATSATTSVHSGPFVHLDGRIAVIGMACRFPGASNVEMFWDSLAEGRCAISEVPASRWDTDQLYSPEYEHGKSIGKWGGFLEGIEDFDAAYFGMSTEEATYLDPAIRMVLETAVTCARDAGYADEELSGHNIGVFVGTRMSSYRLRGGIRSGKAGLGADQSFCASRVAYHFDLHGPSLVVDTACSSSLVGVQLACRSLLAGESEMAFAAGVDLLLDAEPYLEFSAARALSRSGRCSTFDEEADGFVPAEGCGVVLLKPLAQALEDGDRVHAVIEAIAVNNDGRTMGLTTPNLQAQADVVRRALAASGLSADAIGMVEAHGTATMIGDPIELRALSEAFRETTERTGFCAIGSVKSNMGHLLSASGIAGLLKVILALERGQIPPTIHCRKPNPRFDFANSPFFPVTELSPWTTKGGIRAAGVSAFGLSGTNAHLIASSFDPAPRACRKPLPPPHFQRKRCWLAPKMEDGAVVRDQEIARLEQAGQGHVFSLLDLNFNETSRQPQERRS